jgi:hypothetical protein
MLKAINYTVKHLHHHNRDTKVKEVERDGAEAM